ncbi:OmpA family protein [Solimonas terrae]|uniref:OmpA family protein n=1 Tax=Solimonas terrae TaxID=1396819 RepID=A0A6M2BRR8_9GAMM|nr:OmpA family protein [Solimonas terrae]NGY05306.1 OmpA family protein [Solimonas terrae]
MKTAFGIFGAAMMLAAATSYAQDATTDQSAAPADASTAPADDTAAAPAGDSAAPTDDNAAAAPTDDSAAAPADSSAAASDSSSSESASDTATDTSGSESTTTESTTLAAPSYIGIQGFYLRPDKDRGFGLADTKNGGGFDVLFGHQGENRFGYELHGSVETIETGKQLRTDFYNYALGGDLFYAFGDRTHLTPYVLVGGGGDYNDIYPNGAQDDGFSGFVNGGVGIVTGPITKVGQIRLRADVRYVYDFFGDKYGDIRAALGIEIPLFEEKKVEVAAAADNTKIVEVPTGLTDSDGDGVVDSADKCPDTPAGSRVDGDGCPFDKVINLKGVTFEFNKTRLRPDAQTILDWAVGVLKKYPDMKVEIAGHTDSIGSDAYNQKLSEGRAQAVMQYFVDHGVPADQLTAKGYGETQPIADNKTADGRELNRRVELRILN